MPPIADHIKMPYPLPVRRFDFTDFPAPARDVLSMSPYPTRFQPYGNRGLGAPQYPNYLGYQASEWTDAEVQPIPPMTYFYPSYDVDYVDPYPRRPDSFAAGLSGFDLGGIDLGSIDIGATVQSTIDNGWDTLNSSIQHAIATRSGSTADPVPVQNQVTANTLAPVSAALQMPAVVASVPTLQALAKFLDAAHTTWVNFLNQNWDARAQGAYNTLEPYFKGLSATIQADLIKLGASAGTVPGIPSISIPSTDWSTLAIYGVLGYFGLKALGVLR